MRHNGGWIKIYRSLAKHPVASDFDCFGLFCWLLLHVNWETSRVKRGGHLITINPGQILTGRKELARMMNCSESSVERRLKWLEACGSIGQQADTHGRVITLLHWSEYQSDAAVDRTATDTTVEQRPIQRSNSAPTRMEERKKERREEEPSGTLVPLSSAFKPSSFVDLWNGHCGTLSRATKLNETRSRKVRARWKEQPTEAYWQIAIAKMASSSFCCQGKWATLDWLITNDTNHVKVMEGKYDDHDGQNKPSWMDTWKPPPDEGASQ